MQRDGMWDNRTSMKVDLRETSRKDLPGRLS